MDELINVVVQRTGFSQEQASQAVTAVIGSLKTNYQLPLRRIWIPFVGRASGNSGTLASEAGEMLKGKLGGTFCTGRS